MLTVPEAMCLIASCPENDLREAAFLAAVAYVGAAQRDGADDVTSAGLLLTFADALEALESETVEVEAFL